MKGRILVAGFATRHVAQSAFHAGYSVCAVDHFCDQDLSWYTEDRIRFDNLEDLPRAIEEMSSRHRFDMMVATSGAEGIPTGLPVCGTSPEQVRRFLDKLEMQNFFGDLGIPVPPLAGREDYPYMIKPRSGAGGWRNAVIGNMEELAVWEQEYAGTPYIRQSVASGMPASVCCVTDGTRACALAANEQILRGAKGAEFGFCGSVTPCTHPQTGTMIAYAERIAAASGCVGTVGIDFVAGDETWAIEINPRFQATVDTVEMATGCNIFSLHRQACGGILPKKRPVPCQFAARRILFAEKDMTIRPDLKKFVPCIADIPWPGTEFEEDQAVASVFGRGDTRQDALTMLDKNITAILQYLR